MHGDVGLQGESGPSAPVGPKRILALLTSRTLHEQHEVGRAAREVTRTLFPLPTPLPALDLGEKERDPAELLAEKTDEAQALGVSAATPGWSGRLPRTQCLFFLFFLLYFSPLNVSVSCGGGRRISKPLSHLLAVPPAAPLC